jgi:hypothetical protein
MSDMQPDELAALRRRVYGPDADPRGDPAAMARLSDLQRPRVAATEVPAPDPAPISVAAALEPAATVAGDASVTGTTKDRLRLKQKVLVLWAASVVAAVLTTASITSWLHKPPGSEVAVLTLSAENDLPVYRDEFYRDVLVSEDFSGLTVIYLRPEFSSRLSDRGCLQIVPTVESATVESAFGCGAGPYPPSVPMTVIETMPESLRDRFPSGTTLRFVLENRSVRVLSSGPGRT